jgi:hypothetical protein
MSLNLWSGRAIQAGLNRKASWVVQRFGPRKTATTGVIVSSLSLLGSSFSTGSVGGLVVLHGIIFGLASAQIYLVSASHSPQV